MKAQYWQNKGKFQNELEKLRDDLVPKEGKCETVHGELIRAICSLYHDVYNNGYCNQDVLTYKKEVLFQHEQELKTHGLSHDQWITVKCGFDSGYSRDKDRKKCSLYEDSDFVEALDATVDSVVLYCLSKEETKEQK